MEHPCPRYGVVIIWVTVFPGMAYPVLANRSGIAVHNNITGRLPEKHTANFLHHFPERGKSVTHPTLHASCARSSQHHYTWVSRLTVHHVLGRRFLANIFPFSGVQSTARNSCQTWARSTPSTPLSPVSGMLNSQQTAEPKKSARSIAERPNRAALGPSPPPFLEEECLHILRTWMKLLKQRRLVPNGIHRFITP